MTTDTRHGEDFVPTSVVVLTYLSYAVLIVVGHVRDFLGSLARRLGLMRKTERSTVDKPGYAELLADFDSFFTRRLYTRIRGSY